MAAPPRRIALVGPEAPGLADDLAQATGARVELWGTTDGLRRRDREALVAALAGHTGTSVLVLAQDGPPQVLDVRPSERS